MYLLFFLVLFKKLFVSLLRDKTICSRYFTTSAVRLFLEAQERKRELIIFGNSFLSKKLPDEKVILTYLFWTGHYVVISIKAFPIKVEQKVI